MTSQLYISTFKIPEEVNIEKNHSFYKFSGPLGHTYLNTYKIDPTGLGAIFYNKKKKQLQLSSPSPSLFGLLRAIFSNKIRGVSRGYLSFLKVIGIGYRASLDGQTLLLKCGKSHDIIYTLPPAIQIFLLDSTHICLFGVDGNQLSQIAAKIRHLRPPSDYKEKGISFLHEPRTYKAVQKK